LDVIASQLGHRDLRMTKRYARIAGAQVRQAVNGLDSVLGAAVSHPFIAGRESLQEVNPV
jgi:hypothetical protein